MARAGLTRERVVDLALAVVDNGGVHGFDNLTLAAVAGRAGVAVPSLYKHVASLDDVRRGVAIRCVGELREALAAASIGRSGSDALRAVADAYRSYARQHPGRYLATQVHAVGALPDDDGVLAKAADAVVQVAVTALAGYGIASDRMVAAVRAVRSGLHGFIALEVSGGFGLPVDTDESFEFLVSVLDAGLRSAADRGRPGGDRALRLGRRRRPSQD